MDSKVSEKDMREVYFQAFGKEYDSADRKQAPLPLEIAYIIALKKLKREGKYAGGGEITNDTYYESVNHFIYFCMNYPRNFLDAFGSLKNHLSNKFKNYYNKYGTYGVMIQFYAELDAENRRTLTDYSLKNYKGTPIDSDVSEIEYFNSVNHFFFFCFNFPPNFMDAFSSHLKVHLSSKWTNAYEKKGSVGAMIYFWSELDNENRRKLADWVRVNYTGTRLYEVGGALGDVAGMLPSPLPMSTIQAMADGGSIENNYKDKYEGDIWNNIWNYDQKFHFLSDHVNEIGFDEEFYNQRPKSTKRIQGSNGAEIGFRFIDKDKIIDTKYVDLPRYVKHSLQKHIRGGQYVDGGSTGKQAISIGGQIELFANRGGVKSDYYIFEGVDNLNGKPLYRVESSSESDNEYVGEWHTDKSDAEKELKSLENKFSDGGDIKEGDKVSWRDNDYILSRIEENMVAGFRDTKYYLTSTKVGVKDANLDSLRDVKKVLFKNGGGVKSDYYIFEGVDNLNGKPLYRVESTSESDNEYVGEWHTNKKDAQKELDGLSNNSLGVVKVIFENPEYNYTTNVGAKITESEARKYFVGKMFDVGVYPKENMQKAIDIEFSKSKDSYADGGEIVDLFEDYENIPANVQEVLDRYSEKYGEDFGEMNYNDMAEMHKEIEKLGYTFDSGLDNMPYGLRPVGVELNQLRGYEEYGLGGFLLGAGLGAFGYKLYLDSKTKKGKEKMKKTFHKIKRKVFKYGGEIEERVKEKLSKNFALPFEVVVYVPSTQDADTTISESEFKNRIIEVETYLAKLFGGFSSNPVDGGYNSDEKGLIKEDVFKVFSFASRDGFEPKMEELVIQIKKWCKVWGQEAIGLEFEGDLFYVEA